MNKEILERYARLVIQTGINIQPDQLLVISSPIDCAPFARVLAKAAYQAGARDCIINWTDELSAKLRYLHAPDAVFDEFPEWRKDFYMYYVQNGAAFITISASDPELLKEVDPRRLSKAEKASSKALEEYRARLMKNENSWCVVSVPSPAWASKVFPHAPEDQAVRLLWEAILKAVRADVDDPVAAWQKHTAALRGRREFLNSAKFQYLHYRSSNGTDLMVELPEGHIWMGGSEETTGGIEFVANMPTEEVYTAPKKNGVNGTAVNSRPLVYNGNLIDNFRLTFKAGTVADFSAEKGYEVLKELLETDEGSCRLGEVALVPYKSPISNSKLLFYNTLFDENASCHFAFGKAYPTCIKNGSSLSKKEMDHLGVNDSLIHEDFMVGTEDLEITGITAEGKRIPVLVNGDFAGG